MSTLFPTPVRLYVSIGALSMFLGACYVHTRAHMVQPIVRRARLCPAAVTLFDTPDDITVPYSEIARLEVWWVPDATLPNVQKVEMAERSKAAKLGANGIIRGRLIGNTESFPPRYENNLSGTAIFIPSDSARAARTCVPVGRLE